jgi:hypothetical protein
MRLSRVGETIPYEDSDEYETEGLEIHGPNPNTWMAIVMFYRFGDAPELRPTFEVGLQWSDVEKAIQKFDEMGHPGARRLQRDRELVGLIENFMRLPHSN